MDSNWFNKLDDHLMDRALQIDVFRAPDRRHLQPLFPLNLFSPPPQMITRFPKIGGADPVKRDKRKAQRKARLITKRNRKR